MSAPETATSYSVGNGAHSPRVKGQRCEVAANLYLVRRLRMPGDVPSLSPHIFVACRATAFPLFLHAAEICREISLSAWG